MLILATLALIIADGGCCIAPNVAWVTDESVHNYTFSTAILETVSGKGIADRYPNFRSSSRLRLPTSNNPFQNGAAHALFSVSAKGFWFEWYGPTTRFAGSPFESQPFISSRPLDNLVFPIANDLNLKPDGVFESANLIRTNAIAPYAPVSCLLASSKDTCERFEIVPNAEIAGCFSMLFGRLASGTPPTYKEIGKAPCPFRELFVAVPAGDALYFVTATGKLYFSKRDKKGVPEKIARVPLSFGVRIEGVLIDARTGKSFVFSNWDSQPLLAGEYPKFKPRGKPAVPLPADAFDFALAMRSQLIASESILPFAEKK